MALLYYVLLLLCLVYVSWSTIWNKGYMEYEAPVGTVSISLDDAPSEHRQHHLDSNSYCSRSDIGCRVWDAAESAQRGSDRSLLATTFVRDVYERRLCAATDVQCAKVWEPVRTEQYFIAGAENFEVRQLVR